MLQLKYTIGHFRVALNVITKARLRLKFSLSMEISFHSYVNETNFQIKSFTLSLAFVTRFKTIRKWPTTTHNNDTVKENT